MTIIFTRYLYTADEVILTFMECLLKQEDIEECYYWFYEYYKSGYEEKSIKLLWKIYYDYYYIKNPKMEEKINNKYLKWKETKDIKYMLWVVKNLFRLNKCHTILLLRTYYNNRNTDILTGEMINIDTIKYKNKEEILFIKAVKQKKKIAIAYYLKRIKDDDRKLILVNKSLNENIEYNNNYSDKYHYLLAKVIKNLKITPKKKVYYKMVLNKEVKNILETDESCRNDGKLNDVNYIYKTLSKRRIYGISKNIGCFNLARQNKDINHIFWYHWEYYAYKCPLWQGRFDKYNIEINEKKQTIDFKDEDEYEEFYEEYGYEPDEQSSDIQEKSICKMENFTIKNWINSIFDKKVTKNIRIKIDY
tara:strand:+ start:243 stop:1328 length:1086 start_codon:yes stop_codon:yes gene_type:complete